MSFDAITQLLPHDLCQQEGVCNKSVVLKGAHRCEIFDRSDFHDFTPYSRYGRPTLGFKNFFYFLFRGSFGAAKFLVRMLSLISRRDF
jgi:hypothetical protein